MSATRPVLARTFGWPRPPLLLAALALSAMGAAGTALDRVLFPAVRRAEIRNPIVIVGNPRTGTTFLQQWLVKNGFGAGLEVWRMVYPSLVQQTLIRPFLPLMERFSPARYHKTAAKDVSLTSVEVDDVALLARYFDGFFLYGFFLAWDESDRIAEVDPALRDTAERDFSWLDTVWKRSLVWSRKERVVAKSFTLGARLPEFLVRHPDAKVLYMARDPMAVIPSTLSLVSGVLESGFGYARLPEAARHRWALRVERGLVELMRRFHADLTSGRIPKENLMVVRYDRMMADFEGVMQELCAFVGHPPDEALLAEIRRTAEEQRRYVSKHGYDLQRFGLDPERVRADCSFFYETYLA
jgi:hypothetical protein